MRALLPLCVLAACSHTASQQPDAQQQHDSAVEHDAAPDVAVLPDAFVPPDAFIPPDSSVLPDAFIPIDGSIDGGTPTTASQIWVAGDVLVDQSNIVGGFSDTATLPFGPLNPPTLVIPGGTSKLAGPPTAGFSTFTFDATKTKIAFVADLTTAGTFDLYVANADGSTPVMIVPGQAGVEIASVFLSPDGTKLAYTSDSVAINNGYDLYFVGTTAGSTPVQVSPARPANSPVPANQDVFSLVTWSADSRYIAFSADLTTDTFDQAWCSDTTSATPTGVALLGIADIGVQASGAQGVRGALLFDAADNVYFRARTIAGSASFQLFQAKPDGSARTDITNKAPLRTDTTTPDIGAFGTSPDGTKLVFAADSPVAGAYDFYVAPVATLTATKVTALAAAGHSDFNSPLWFSADGSKIAYVANFSSARNEPFVSKLDGTDTHRLVSVLATCVSCTSPDANVIQWTLDGSAVYIEGDLTSNNDTKLFRADPTMTDQVPTLAVDMPTGGDVFNVFIRPAN